MEEIVETCEPKYDIFLTGGMFKVMKRNTLTHIPDLNLYIYNNIDEISNLYKSILNRYIELDFQMNITSGSESSTGVAVSTYYSKIFENLKIRDTILSINKGAKILSNYISITEQDSSERALVYLYTSLIAILNDLTSCELFLESVNVELLSVDAIVHILNSLSPNRPDLKNWPSFVSLCEKRLIELEGRENAKDLLDVIL